MATKKLSVGTWKDRDGVRRMHKRGPAPAWHPTYDTLSETAHEKLLRAFGVENNNEA